ncbi:ABC transporter ATP-binding protein [Candidatus Izemoplasma sp. B36]|uniref:ABC transporter ATP-binding protein n=1 Tax=Candidatus Izemoplasma sp. B36 TaxID=3242468 RepID=UPI00355690BA
MDYTSYGMLDVLKYYWNTFKKDKDLIVVWYLLFRGLFTGAIPVLAVVFPKYIIDAISLGNLNRVVLFVLLFGGISMVLAAASTYMLGVIGGRVLASRVRKATEFSQTFRDIKFKYLEDATFHRKRNEAQATFRNGGEGYQGFIEILITEIPAVVSIIGLIFILGIFNPWIIVVALLSAMIQLKLALKAKKYTIDQHEERTDYERKAQYFYRTSQDYTFAKDIRINQMSNPLEEKYNEKANSVLSILRRTLGFECKMSLFDVLFLLITNGLTYYLVISAYFKGSITLGTITMTIMSIIAVTVQMATAFRNLARIKEETDKTRKYMAFIDEDLEFDTEDSLGKKIKFKKFNIEFKNVSFKYPNSDKYVLNNISFKVNDMSKLALVGINGAGKTTIVKLISGLYLPTKGNVYINGHSTKDINTYSLRTQLAVVFQDVNVYAATMLENITGLDPTETERRKALDKYYQVGLKDKIESYQKKEDQILLKALDEEGVELSGGEAQKLSIARALYKENTKLIILDEPTAALDAIAEKEIYEKFNELVDNRTAIMISHRLASTRFCDNIIFLENGQIIEEGTHQDLMNLENGKYREMFITQGKYYVEGSVKNEIQFSAS